MKDINDEVILHPFSPQNDPKYANTSPQKVINSAIAPPIDPKPIYNACATRNRCNTASECSYVQCTKYASDIHGPWAHVAPTQLIMDPNNNTVPPHRPKRPIIGAKQHKEEPKAPSAVPPQDTTQPLKPSAPDIPPESNTNADPPNVASLPPKPRKIQKQSYNGWRIGDICLILK